MSQAPRSPRERRRTFIFAAGLILSALCSNPILAEGFEAPVSSEPGPYSPYPTEPLDWPCQLLGAHDLFRIICDLNCDGKLFLYCDPYDLDGDVYQDGIPDGVLDDFWTFYDGD